MTQTPITQTGRLLFRLRFNTAHGDTELYWRVIINDTEYLVRTLQCNVATYSDAWFDPIAGTIKYHIAGVCSEFCIDEEMNAVFN
jgi:hypothetical protein